LDNTGNEVGIFGDVENLTAKLEKILLFLIEFKKELRALLIMKNETSFLE